ncbi:unnamed protein product [Malus baccata var. baccata]
MVCKLHNVIYGLKQSPRTWYAKLTSALESEGFLRSNPDSSLFVHNGISGKLVVLIYVDDLIITGLFLNQRKCVMDLLEKAEFTDCKPVATLIDNKLKLTINGKALKNVTYYKRLVGKLIYLTITHPDITFAVSLVSQFMQAPTVERLSVVKRIIRYLKGSIDRGIFLRNNHSTEIRAYIVADWAGNAIDTKSTTSYCTFVRDNILPWKSKKQQVIARSSVKEKY